MFFINKLGDNDNVTKDKLNDNLLDEDERALINGQPITRSKLNDSKRFRALVSTSAVPAFRPDRPASLRQTPLECTRQSKRLDKVVKSLEQNKEVQQIKKQQKVDPNARYDLWETKEKTPIGDVYVDYAEDFEKVRLARIFKCPRKQNQNVLKKPSLLPAVEQPHPGLSYNPDKEEHTDLLIAIGDRKKKELREKRKLNKKVKAGFDPTVNVSLENAKEMASGLFSESEPDDEANDDEPNDEDQAAHDVIISDLKRRKSNKARRNKIAEHLDKLKAKRRKDKRRLETEFTKIKHYVKEAKAAEQQTNLRKQLREQRKMEKMYLPARLGKEKYKDPEPEFCLEHELNGSLRKINTDGNLLMDRFKSLQRRNLIEHRRVQLKRRTRAARKRVVRNSMFNKDLFEKEYLEADT